MKWLKGVVILGVMAGGLFATSDVWVTFSPVDTLNMVTSRTVLPGETDTVYFWFQSDQEVGGFMMPWAFKPGTPEDPSDAVNDTVVLGPEILDLWHFFLFSGDTIYYGLAQGFVGAQRFAYVGETPLVPNVPHMLGWAIFTVDPNAPAGETILLDTTAYAGGPASVLSIATADGYEDPKTWYPCTLYVQSSGPPSDTLHVANYGDVATINLPSGGDYDIWFYEPGTRGPSLHIYFHNITVGGDLNLAVYNNAYPNTINSINKYWDINFNGTADSYDLDFYYLDTDVPAGLDETQFHAWRLDMGVPQWVDMGGTPDAVNNMVTGVSTTELSPWTLGPPGVTAVEEGAQVPRVFFLNQNTPNPFWGRTTIAFGLPKAADVSLVVYNAAGQKVRTLVSGHKNAGTYTVTWDGRDDAGRPVAAGAYFFKFQAGEYQSLKKTLLLK